MSGIVQKRVGKDARLDDKCRSYGREQTGLPHSENSNEDMSKKAYKYQKYVERLVPAFYLVLIALGNTIAIQLPNSRIVARLLTEPVNRALSYVSTTNFDSVKTNRSGGYRFSNSVYSAGSFMGYRSKLDEYQP